MCGLWFKKGSDRRKQKKKEKIRKNFIQGEINEYDHDILKFVSSMFKKHNFFFANVGSYRDIPV